MDGRIPFRVAIVTVVVGLLALTCGALILYALHQGKQSAEILKREYLDQVAQGAASEVGALAAQRGRGPALRARPLRERRPRARSARPGARALRHAAGSARLPLGELRRRRRAASRAPTACLTREIILNVSDTRAATGVSRASSAPARSRPTSRARHSIGPTIHVCVLWYRRAAADARGDRLAAALRIRRGRDRNHRCSRGAQFGARIQGVLTVDFTLAGIARFLERIELSHGAVVMLFDQVGTFIAGAPGAGREAAIRATDGWEGVPPPPDSVRRTQVVVVRGEMGSGRRSHARRARLDRGRRGARGSLHGAGVRQPPRRDRDRPDRCRPRAGRRHPDRYRHRARAQRGRHGARPRREVSARGASPSRARC